MKKNILKFIPTVLVMAGFFVLLFPFFVQAANEFARQIEISAYIVNGKDIEIPNGQYDIRFAIYTSDRESSAQGEGSPIWREEQTVEIKNGVLNAYLGSVNPLSEDIDFSENSYYLGVRIGQDSEMVPRKKIGSVSLSINALNAASLQGAILGDKEGDIPVLGNNDQLDASLIPEITELGAISVGAWEADPIGLAYGGTGATAVGIAGAVAYSDGAKYAFTTQGAAGQVLVSGGIGAPTWGSVSGGLITNDSLNFTEFADNLTLDADTTIDTNGFDFNVDGTLRADSIIISGQATIGTLGLNLYTNTSFIPSTTGLNLGSSSNHWANIYVDNLSVGGTDVNGTTSEYFTINSDSVTEEDMGLRFYRSSLNGYAALVWDSANQRFDLFKRENTAEYADLAINTISATGTGNNYFAGNVGIGTTSPFAKLSVNGTFYAGTTTINGLISQTGLGGSTYFGYGSGISDDLSDNYNTAFGYQALGTTTATLTGSNNVAVGAQSLYSNTTGNQNTAVGMYSLYSNISGFTNSAFGYRTLYLNISGQNNSAVGNKALYSNTSGSYNTSAGGFSMYYNTTGYENVASGYESLYSNTTGYYNVAIGNYSVPQNSDRYIWCMC